jgi:hypothetical protein
VRAKPEWRDGCDNMVDSANPGRFARRPLLRAAVLGQPDLAGGHGAARDGPLRSRPATGAVAVGAVGDISPHVLILQTRDGEERITLTPETSGWRGRPVSPASIRHGDQVIVRKTAIPLQAQARAGGGRRTIAERVWAGIGRATGTIMAARTSGLPRGAGKPCRLELLVDEGPDRQPRTVLIASEVYQQILVRFPRLEPGYLIDVIGLRHDDFLQALTPATAQPAYRADRPPPPPGRRRERGAPGAFPNPVRGTAVWHEPGDEPPGLLGLAYPALDPETGCAHAGKRARSPGPDPHAVGPGCVRLPLLSVGSVVTVGNDCTGMSAPLPVTSCGAAARLFCDRCVECSASPRGRIADLTMGAFVELGGRLEAGCFNASLTVPG